MRSASLFSAWFAVCVFLVGPLPAASTETYPNRPVRMIVAYPPGGTLDALSRIMAEKLSANWGQPVSVEISALPDGEEVPPDGPPGCLSEVPRVFGFPLVLGTPGNFDQSGGRILSTLRMSPEPFPTRRYVGPIRG